MESPRCYCSSRQEMNLNFALAPKEKRLRASTSHYQVSAGSKTKVLPKPLRWTIAFRLYTAHDHSPGDHSLLRTSAECAGTSLAVPRPKADGLSDPRWCQNFTV